MSDQHSPNTLEGLGHPAVKTPSLDYFMSKGITFTNAYSAYPMCTPARASFMTGKLTPQHGVWELGTPLRSDEPTWAHILRLAGYSTSISGRMHFIGHDKMHGFETRVFPEISDNLTPFTYGDWDKPQDDNHVMLNAVIKAGPTKNESQAEIYDKEVLDAALGELDRLAMDNKQQWALMVGFFLPHFPYEISREYYDLYNGVDIPLPRTPPNNRSYEDLVPQQLWDNRKWLGLTSDGVSEDQVRNARRCYYGMITCMDKMIGKLISHLEDLGISDNTWIIYLSDHGDNMGEHGFWSKMNFYEDSVRIPFIIVPPNCKNAGKRCYAPVSQIDWMTTVIELTNQQPWFESLPGRSLLPLLEDPSQSWEDRTIISDYACDGTRVPMRMVRRGHWKASFALNFPPTLFELERDPYEWNDLGGNPSFQNIIQELDMIARSDGWNPESLRKEIFIHKRRLKYISMAES